MDDSVSRSGMSDKREPLNSAHPPTPRLNERLKTEHIDLDRNDVSCNATATRGTADMVANWFTPQQVIGILRLLKAITFCFLILTMVAGLMYVLFVEIMSSKEYRSKAGGFRDMMIRIYGLAFAVIIVCIELEVRSVTTQFAGLKPFVTRGLMMLLIAVITGSHPKQDSSSNDYEDDAGGEDDEQEYMMTNLSQDYEIPKSALAFQMVTSYALAACSIGYILCGLMCFDRFKPKAFLSIRDPRIDTSNLDPVKDPRIKGALVSPKKDQTQQV